MPCAYLERRSMWELDPPRWTPDSVGREAPWKGVHVGNRSTRYPPEFKIEAVRLYRETGRSQREIASELGVATETLGRWVRRIDVDEGPTLGPDNLRVRGAAAGPQREPDPRRGTGHPEKGRALLREGGAADPVRIFRFVHAEKPPTTLP